MTPQQSVDEGAALVALLRTRPDKMTWSAITEEVVACGSAVKVWESRVPGTLLDGLSDDDPLVIANRDVQGWVQQGAMFITILDDLYPARLRGIHEAPPVLFARGSLMSEDPAISVVGSREASARGLAIAQTVATSLVEAGITVVAGLALGIDTAAHRAALDAGGRTVAVIGTGINKVYPRPNKDLHEEIAENGLLLSQFWPDAPPQRHTFLMRNATMSGYGIATVVVEAGEQSGARAQARMAVGHGRPVILTDLVVDRNSWAKELIGRPGVHVASGRADVMDIVRRLTTEQDHVEDQLRQLICA
jgi:DNA processing protein